MNRFASALAALGLALTMALAAALAPSAVLAQDAVKFIPQPGQLYQLHNNGEIYGFLSQKCQDNACKCTPTGCPAWSKLDFNPMTYQLAPIGDRLYQMHTTGLIFGFKNATCSTHACMAWEMIDDDPGAAFGMLTASHGHNYVLYQLHRNGSVWRRYAPQACDGANCPDWRQAAFIPATTEIAASDDNKVGDMLFLREANGNVWRLRGWTCVTERCDEPELIERGLSTAIATTRGEAYQIRRDGTVWRSNGKLCETKTCAKGWQQYDNGWAAQIVATDKGLYQRRANGEILYNKGTPCQSAKSCTGWTTLDKNGATVEISASPWGLYQRHADGSLWRYTGTPCGLTGCPGWEMIDANPRTRKIASAN